MSSSPLTFTDLPTELKCRIMEGLDFQSLLRMSLTSKAINEVIYASEVLVLELEAAQSDLSQCMHTRSTSMARKFLEAYNDARVNLPIATRPCVVFPAPPDGIRNERLFRGIFTCITENNTLHVWNIRNPDPTSLPQEFMRVRQPDLIDVVIEPNYNLLVVLCYSTDDNIATIVLLDLSARGTRKHSMVTSPSIIHIPLPGDSLEYYHGQQLLTLHGPLLALVYHRDSRLESRRGIIWNWRTGESVYDSMDFQSSSDFHDLLLLPMPGFFLVTASTFLVGNPGAPLGAWIELRHSDFSTTPATCRVVAEYSLPEFMNPAEHCLGSLEFSSTEPPPPTRMFVHDLFPFTSNMVTCVHALNIWYKPRPNVIPQNNSSSRIYLIVHNAVFLRNVAMWLHRDDPTRGTSFPIRKAWNEWAPLYTTMWDYESLGLLSATSSVCGSRICTVTNPKDDEFELLVVDFNMKIPCSKRNCTDPLAHFYPTEFDPNNSPWAGTVRTWLPFHTTYKRFGIQREGGKQLICTAVHIDEERIVFSTCIDVPDMLDVDVSLDPTSWKVVHLVREPTAVGSNCFTPRPLPPNDESQEYHDKICRMCKEQPHTDGHILLECTANPAVMDLRQTYLGFHHHSVVSFHDFFKEFTARRNPSRISISMLATEVNSIYQDLPECSELVLVDRENPASILFTTSG